MGEENASHWGTKERAKRRHPVWIMAGIMEPITFGGFMGSVAAGLGIALGVGTAYARGARKRAAMLMDRIHHTMNRMGEWPEGFAGPQKGSGARGDLRTAASSARDIERLDALLDRREAMGSRVLLRRLTYATAVGASLASILPIAVRFFPTEYPLPWIVVGGLGWIFTRTVRRLFRGIQEQRALDREIDTRLRSTDGPAGELRPEV